MSDSSHWENVYTTKATDSVSWYQPHADLSLALIDIANINKCEAIIDIGGGASTLVDDLFKRGFNNLSVLDISNAALVTAKMRLGENSDKINWLTADITQAALPHNHYKLWHDRAVFHFLTTVDEREAYKRNLLDALQADGFMLIATFAEDGPLKCSNLPVMRYSAEQLYEEFRSDFDVIETRREMHRTPFNTSQSFVYCLMRRH